MTAGCRLLIDCVLRSPSGCGQQKVDISVALDPGAGAVCAVRRLRICAQIRRNTL